VKQVFRQSTISTLRFSPTEGPPETAATLQVIAPDNEDVVAAGTAATLPTVATTLNDATADAFDTDVTLTAVTNVVRKGRYWVDSPATGPLEQVIVRRVAGSVAYLVEGLKFDHVTGVAFKGSEITYSLSAANLATVDENYRVIWSYTVDGVSYTAEQLFDVVKRPFKLPLSYTDLIAEIPEGVRLGPSEDLDLEMTMAAAERMIRRDFHRDDRRLDLLRDPDQLTDLAIMAVKLKLYQRVPEDPEWRKAADQVRKEYKAEYEALKSGGLSWVDEDEDDGIDGGNENTGLGEEQHVRTPAYLLLG
jgi:hypothetical protein